MIPPDILLEAYFRGAFPMADSRDGEIAWYTADPRGVIPLNEFHIPERLRRDLRRRPFEVTVNHCFETVMRSCGDRPDTWISEEMVESYAELHRLGYAHSVESWMDGSLVGGLYGVSIRGAFFGESMFHRVPNASKAALVFLLQRLRERSYRLLDTQMVTPIMRQFGAQEISSTEYVRRLAESLRTDCHFG
ncbi:MAG: leucyl/phenylalanyl-tRNA--protein transferase [Armatimonadetes bacterium]|nr:leucyl/phenylalanyl-tRNA--protein transferase [Armatimonadota bacterium]PIU66973.1 MAG: leucyl/phenylalanyl-tRNA--protein transferase [Armatimonadetes bacterium CG07_land_8_20_14_0_80_59_28]PIX41659.1 MAG: leucyl/phenylalanyl-tRNA--protein transferase [Armatimonadetes bacterium CG_4_8_14_3_um_filter_58_9]PIY43769.1 MAG: leucyl/phenylalanyl-tRNA--protein transferase [Armatimonadetes bacterium CG_4_10_14_3_um_filter_59_10]PJB67964.1 MAG: leucyl/phenylalanyl-tRNA--protein transferase [Armatimon